MLQAMLAGVASIRAQQTRMNVIGNNLANVNTTAFKSSSVTFQDMLSQTYRGAYAPGDKLGGQNPLQMGLGVLVAGTNNNMTQGSLNATNRQGDLAIQGNGFFAVSDGNSLSYTRDGSFDIDASGDLVMTATGQRVVGWKADANGAIDTTKPIDSTSAINIPLGQLSAVRQTAKATLVGNLDGAAKTATDSWSTTVRVYDAIGGAHDISIKFSNPQTPPTGANPPTDAAKSWDWEATEGTTVVGSSTSTGNQPIYFNSTGQMVNPTALGGVTIPASGSTAASNISLDFKSLTGVAGSSNVNVQSQDGYPAGSLQGFSISNEGVMTGIFTNGLTRNLGQLALANFANDGGLERTGNNLWRPSDNSGPAQIGSAKTGGRGSISSGFLEQSNVDIGQEFTDLIITQRGFQANTKIVTTVDEMMQDLINIKR